MTIKIEKSNDGVKKKKMETSKKIALLSGVCFFISILYIMFIFTYSTIAGKECDVSILITLISTTSAVFGTTCAFYFTKAKSENIFKIRRSFLKIKYLILDKIKHIDDDYIQSELEQELSKIECGLEDEENTIANEEITYKE